MSQVHYTVDQVWALLPQFKEMVRDVVNRMLNVPDWREVDFKETFKVDGNDFEFAFKTVPDYQLHYEVPEDLTVVIATTFIGGNPDVFTTQFSDYKNPTTIPEDLLDSMTHSFVATVISGMARDWYFNDGMHDRIVNFIDQDNMEGIVECVSPGLSCSCDKHGYYLSYTNKDGKCLYAIQNYNALKGEDPRNTYKSQFERYLNDIIVVLLGSGSICNTGWTKPLN